MRVVRQLPSRLVGKVAGGVGRGNPDFILFFFKFRLWKEKKKANLEQGA